jgi:hypothetical protein
MRNVPSEPVQNDDNRYIYVQHNYVRRQHTTTKSRKPRRVDMSRELRRSLFQLRDERLVASYAKGKNDIHDDFAFTSPRLNPRSGQFVPPLFPAGTDQSGHSQDSTP